MLASPKTRRHPRMGELSLWDTANSSLFRSLSTAAPPPHLAGVLELIQDMDVGDRTDRDCKLYVSPYNFPSCLSDHPRPYPSVLVLVPSVLRPRRPPCLASCRKGSSGGPGNRWWATVTHPLLWAGILTSIFDNPKHSPTTVNISSPQDLEKSGITVSSDVDTSRSSDQVPIVGPGSRVA